MRLAITHRVAAAAILLACIVSLGTPRSAAAPANEYALLQMIPHTVLDTVTNNAAPDSTGAMQLNQGHWTDIVYQRIALQLIWAGAAENDSSKVDQGWRAIDLATGHIQSDGSFASAPGRTMNAA